MNVRHWTEKLGKYVSNVYNNCGQGKSMSSGPKDNDSCFVSSRDDCRFVYGIEVEDKTN